MNAKQRTRGNPAETEDDRCAPRAQRGQAPELRHGHRERCGES